VHLVDERDDLAVAVADLLEHGLEPLLELTAIFGARDHRREVESHQSLVPQRLRHVTGHDALGQSFDDGGLADAGFADEDRIVLGTPRQHLHHPADLGVTADDRIELSVAGARGEIDAVLVQSLVRRLRVRRRHRATAAANLVERVEQRLGGGTGVGEHLGDAAHAGAAVASKTDEQVLGGDVFIAA
jgi:hypothetical protein